MKYCLHIACFNNHLQIVQLLTEKGANIEANDNSQRTPLHIACLTSNLSMVKYLIENGANIEAKYYQQKTPLHFKRC